MIILILLFGFLSLAGFGLIAVFLFKVFKFIIYAFNRRGELADAFREGSAEVQAKQDAKKAEKTK